MISRAICIQSARVYLAKIITEKKRRSQKALESLSQSALEIIRILHYVSTFKPNFNFMTDWGLAYILLAIGYVGISAIIAIASLMIFIE